MRSRLYIVIFAPRERNSLRDIADLGAGEARKERERSEKDASCEKASISELRLLLYYGFRKTCERTSGRTDGRAFAQRNTRDILRAEIVTPTDMRPRTRSKANIRNDTPSVDSRRLAATREERKRERASERIAAEESRERERREREKGDEGREEKQYGGKESPGKREPVVRGNPCVLPEKVHEPPRQK